MKSENLLVLAFDTAGPHLCAAVLRGQDVLADRCEELARGQAERLLPFLEETLIEAGTRWGDLDLLGVGTGPGNFTGIRISVSTARGLALSLGRPAIGVSALDAQVYGLPRPCLATVAARRGSIYVQVHGTEGAQPPALLDEAALSTAQLPKGVPATGDAADTMARVTGGAVLPGQSLAVGIARLAQERAETETSRPTPLYLRAADAAPAKDKPPQIIE